MRKRDFRTLAEYVAHLNVAFGYNSRPVFKVENNGAGEPIEVTIGRDENPRLFQDVDDAYRFLELERKARILYASRNSSPKEAIDLANFRIDNILERVFEKVGHKYKVERGYTDGKEFGPDFSDETKKVAFGIGIRGYGKLVLNNYLPVEYHQFAETLTVEAKKYLESEVFESVEDIAAFLKLVGMKDDDVTPKEMIKRERMGEDDQNVMQAGEKFSRRCAFMNCNISAKLENGVLTFALAFENEKTLDSRVICFTVYDNRRRQYESFANELLFKARSMRYYGTDFDRFMNDVFEIFEDLNSEFVPAIVIHRPIERRVK